MKEIKVFQLLQGPLVVVGLGIALGTVLGLTNGSEGTVQQYVSIPVPATFSDFMSQFTIPQFGSSSTVEGWKSDSGLEYRLTR